MYAIRDVAGGVFIGDGGLFVLMHRDEPVYIEGADASTDGFSVFVLVVLSAASVWLLWHLLW